jgi:hypothetical protein
MDFRNFFRTAIIAAFAIALASNGFAQRRGATTGPEEFFKRVKPGQWLEIEGIPQKDLSILATKATILTGDFQDDDWEIVEDNDTQLVIEFKYREENLPHKYKFLAQCKGKVFIDKEKKRLDKVDFYNTGTVKIKMFNVDKLDMTMYYKPDEGSKTYLLDRETMMFDTHVLGQPVEVKTVSEFYDYQEAK